MLWAPQRSIDRVLRHLEPDANPGGLVYGALAMGTLIAAEGSRLETYVTILEASVLAVCLYWFSRGYEDHFAERLEQHGRGTWRRMGFALVHESSILTGAALPAVALVLCRLVGAPLAKGVTVAVWTAAIELVLLEALSAYSRRLPIKEFLSEVAIGVILALGILSMRIILH